MKRRALLLPFAAALLACTGLGTDSADSAAPTEAGVHQTTACRQYLACADAAGKSNVAKLEEQYGENGSCWQTTKAAMEACDQECDSALSDLEAEYGPGCDGTDTGTTDTSDTGTTDTGVNTDCAILDGYWGFNFDYSNDECGFAAYGNPWYATSTCYGEGSFDLAFDSLGIAIPCSSSGSAFTCELNTGGAVLFVDGASSSKKSAATGEFSFDLGACLTTGGFDAEKN